MKRFASRQAALATAALAAFTLGAAMVQPAAAQPATAPPAAACDRACLDGLVDGYIAALAAHAPSRVPVTPDVRFTENTAPLKLGDGLWRTISGLGTYKLLFADPQGQAAGAIVVVKENGTPALMALRIKARDRRIAEVETIIARKGEGQTLVTDTLTTPLPILLQDVAPARRSSRAELVAIGNKYFDAIEKADGTIVPFADDGFRIENGVRTCNNPPGHGQSGSNPAFARLSTLKCADQLSTRIFTYIQSIRPRRFPVVDVQRGLVLGILRFNHPGDVPYVDTRDFGRVSMAGNSWATHPTSALIAELFKVQDHKIQRVMAVIVKIPYRAPTGWGEGPAAGL